MDRSAAFAKTDTQPAQDGATAEQQHAPARYLLSVFAGLFGALICFVLLLVVLRETDNLPPPAFSNNVCVDEKLSFMRNNPVADPNLLVIGSSVALRHIDGNILAKHAPETQPLNGAFCGLHVNQAVYVTDWLLSHNPGISKVLMVVSPQDLGGCWKTRDAVFDRNDADRYVYDGASPWGYYLRYFSPVSLMRNASKIKDQRANLIEMEPLVFNRFGDGPLNTEKTRALLYGQPEPLDPTCFTALRSFASRLEKEGRQFSVVTSPLHPEWKAEHDPAGTFLARFDNKLREALAGTNAQFWNAEVELATPASAFIDAIHLRWSAAQVFTSAVASRLQRTEPNVVAMPTHSTPMR